jgi:hypothetical protein
LEDILAFLLKDESLDFRADFLIWTELFGFLVLQPHNVNTIRSLDHIRDAAGHQMCEGLFDPR